MNEIKLLVCSVKLGSAESLMRGVESSTRQFEPMTYCECERSAVEPRCGLSLDVNYCDLRQGHYTLVLSGAINLQFSIVVCV